jgi:hypothetical protein
MKTSKFLFLLLVPRAFVRKIAEKITTVFTQMYIDNSSQFGNEGASPVIW